MLVLLTGVALVVCVGIAAPVGKSDHSATPSVCKVPNVRGKRLPSARHLITRAHCRLGSVRRVYSDAVPKDVVIAETPKPGKVLPERATIALVASRGRQPYFPAARVHAAVMTDSILDPEQGTVEAWYRQTSDPVPYKHNPHRIFGGPYSLAGIDEVNLFSQDRQDSGDPRLHFSVFFGAEPSDPAVPHLVAVRSLADDREGAPISALNGKWIHVAGVWDRRGIAGSADTVRLYVNGEVVAASRSSDWGTIRCADRRPAGQWRCLTDVAGCNDTCADTFAVDNLKLWSYAKTDYSDRFEEGSSSARGLLLWNKLGSRDQMIHSAHGPGLVFFDCRNPDFNRRCGIDVEGKLAYPQGVFGRGASVTTP